MSLDDIQDDFEFGRFGRRTSTVAKPSRLRLREDICEQLNICGDELEQEFDRYGREYIEQEIVSITTSFNKSGCSLLEAAMKIYVEETIFNMYMTYILKPQDFEDIWIHNCDYDNVERCEGDHHFWHYDGDEESDLEREDDSENEDLSEDERYSDEHHDEHTEDEYHYEHFYEDDESDSDTEDDQEDEYTEDDEEDDRTWICSSDYIGDFRHCI